MCIIIYKPEGEKHPTVNTLKNCLSSHKDGFGAMWRGEDGICVVKGLYDIRAITAVIDEIPVDVEAAFHFRMATHGHVNAGNCHPFPLIPKNDALTTTCGIFDACLMHNGIISGYGSRNSSELSDTMNFIKRMLKGKVPKRSTYERYMKPSMGKFLVFDPTSTYFYGHFIEDGGLKYSNTTYKDYTRAYVYNWPKKVQKLVCLVSPMEVKKKQYSYLFNGSYGRIINYKGYSIFAEYGYDEGDVELLKEDIDLGIAEGER